MSNHSAPYIPYIRPQSHKALGLIYFLLMAFNIHTIKKWVTVEIEERMVELASGYADQFDGYLREVSQIAKSTAAFIENRPDTTDSSPFYRNGEFWGITTVDIPLEPLREFVDIELKEDMVFAVVTKRTGTFVFSPDPNHIMKESVFQFIEQYGRADVIDHVKAITSGKMGIGKLNNEERQTFRT